MNHSAKELLEGICRITSGKQHEAYQHVLDNAEMFRECDVEASQEFKEDRGCEVRQCYYNCQVGILDDTGEAYDYYEGYAFSGLIPVEHAWLVRRSDGKVIDPTWVDMLEEDAHWFGIRIPKPFLCEKMAKSQAASSQLWKFVSETILGKDAKISTPSGV